jgi:hypothetical protein
MNPGKVNLGFEKISENLVNLYDGLEQNINRLLSLKSKLLLSSATLKFQVDDMYNQLTQMKSQISEIETEVSDMIVQRENVKETLKTHTDARNSSQFMVGGPLLEMPSLGMPHKPLCHPVAVIPSSSAYHCVPFTPVNGDVTSDQNADLQEVDLQNVHKAYMNYEQEADFELFSGRWIWGCS